MEPLFETLLFDHKIYHTKMPGHTPGPGRVFSTLIVGSEKALLIDTGYGIGDYKGYLEKLTDKPLIIVNSHGHIDHASGNCQFKEVWLSPLDYEVADIHTSLENRKHSKDLEGYEDLLVDGTYQRIPLHEGQVFDLGDRTITAYACPGHTAGSMMFLDSLSNYLFTGDNITRRVVLLGPVIGGTTLPEFYEALIKAESLNCASIIAAHVPYIMEPSWIQKVKGIVEGFDPTKGKSPVINFNFQIPGVKPMEYTVGKDFDDPNYCGFVFDANHIDEFLGKKEG